MKKLSESVWGDIRKKSLGKEDRKEDEINHLNPDEFCQYLRDRYETKDFKIDNEQDTRLSIPILNKFDSVTDCIHYNYKLNYISMNTDIKVYVPDLYKQLYETFECEEVQMQSYVQLRIFPKDSHKCNNSFFVDVVDFIMNNAPQKYINISLK